LASCSIRQPGWPRAKHRKPTRRGSLARLTCSRRHQRAPEQRKPVQSVIPPIDDLFVSGAVPSLRTAATSLSFRLLHVCRSGCRSRVVIGGRAPHRQQCAARGSASMAKQILTSGALGGCRWDSDTGPSISRDIGPE
jgi:hypothetical protein